MFLGHILGTLCCYPARQHKLIMKCHAGGESSNQYLPIIWSNPVREQTSSYSTTGHTLETMVAYIQREKERQEKLTRGLAFSISQFLLLLILSAPLPLTRIMDFSRLVSKLLDSAFRPSCQLSGWFVICNSLAREPKLASRARRSSYIIIILF